MQAVESFDSPCCTGRFSSVPAAVVIFFHLRLIKPRRFRNAKAQGMFLAFLDSPIRLSIARALLIFLGDKAWILSRGKLLRRQPPVCLERSTCISTENRQFPEVPDRIDYASSKTNAEIKRRNRDFDVHYFTMCDGEKAEEREKSLTRQSFLISLLYFYLILPPCNISSSKIKIMYNKKERIG